MLLYSAALLAGFLVLFKSADYFVIGSVATANNFSISPMLIGLTVVALGTSAPEIFVAATSSLQGNAEIAVGNAIGSNIANIGMVLGITAVLVPLQIHPDILKNDIPILIFVTLSAGAALMDYKLELWDGLLLLVGLVIFLARFALEHRKTSSIELASEIADIDEFPEMSTAKSVGILTGSLLALLVSSELVVWSVSHIAVAMGVSELVIGLTVIAVGTSLPELVVSVASALKGQTDLAFGNIVGSNIFNILAVLSIPCVLAPRQFDPELMWRDYACMFMMTAVLVIFSYGFKRRIGRIQGFILLGLWFSYLFVLYRASIHLPHPH
ncbi:MAG TPA: calcium/sodium antiporter [Pseudomonadales bacterium]|nr:calcium/sodium antiporter [Pseudomonadales bacterium]